MSHVETSLSVVGGATLRQRLVRSKRRRRGAQARPPWFDGQWPRSWLPPPAVGVRLVKGGWKSGGREAVPRRRPELRRRGLVEQSKPAANDLHLALGLEPGLTRCSVNQGLVPATFSGVRAPTRAM